MSAYPKIMYLNGNLNGTAVTVAHEAQERAQLKLGLLVAGHAVVNPQGGQKVWEDDNDIESYRRGAPRKNWP